MIKRKWVSMFLAAVLLVVVTDAAVFYFSHKAGGPRTGIEYVVKPGDSCRKIAFEQKTSVEQIVALNQLTPDCGSLAVGQKLLLPAP